MTGKLFKRVSQRFAFFLGINSAVLLLLTDSTLLGKSLYVQAIQCNINSPKNSYQRNATEISVNPGQPLVINCSVVLGNWAESIVWSRRETQTRLLSTPGRWAAIVIKEVGLRDAGCYECRMVPEKTSKLEFCEITLHVNFRPNLIKTQGRYTTSPQMVYAGMGPIFHCYASGWPKPKITWLRNTSEIRNGDSGESLWLDRKDDGVDLRILSASHREHSGRYTCLAENKMGECRYVIRVQVRNAPAFGLPPKVTAITSNVTVRKGSQVNLRCAAENTMEIRTVVFWTLNGTKISDDKGKKEVAWHYYTDGLIPKVNFSLAMANVTESDTGDYYCCATTTKGNDRKKVRLSLSIMEEVPYVPVKKRPLLVVDIIISVSLVTGLLIAFIACKLRLKRKRDLRRLERKEYQYDLFVSFCGSDFDWVKEKLMPLLEKHQVKYCIHHRDFEIGKAIVDNIADSIYNSKKVLAVVSEHYMASRFCQEELEMALYRCIEKADSSLLLIKLDDINKRNLPRPLRWRSFLDYSNYRERANWEERLLKQIQDEEKTCNTDILDDKVQLIVDDDASI